MFERITSLENVTSELEHIKNLLSVVLDTVFDDDILEGSDDAFNAMYLFRKLPEYESVLISALEKLETQISLTERIANELFDEYKEVKTA